MRLSFLQTRILLAVAKYYFLTNSQLAMMGFGKVDTIRRATCHLAKFPAKTPLLNVKKFPAYAKTGRLEHVYSTSKFGLRIAAEINQSESDRPASFPLYDLDFFHRRAVISFQFLLDISLAKSNPLGLKVASYDHYFFKTGANHRHGAGFPLHATTRIAFRNNGFFIPDSIFVLSNQKARAVFALECVFGNKKSRTLRQIQKHMKAISERTIATKYHLPRDQDYMALFHFHDEKLMHRVRQALMVNRGCGFAPLHHHFLFTTIDQVKSNIQNCWLQAGDDESRFHFITGQKVGSCH